jgi:hypothetical protein
MALNDRLEMWKEAVVAYFKAMLYQYHVGLLIVSVVVMFRLLAVPASLRLLFCFVVIVC